MISWEDFWANGKVPDVFYKFGPRTQERYLKRFEGELNETSTTA